MKLLPGTALIELASSRGEKVGLIHIPKYLQKVMGRIGKCVDVALYPENQRLLIWKGGKKRWVDAWKDNATFKDMVGSTCVVDTGRLFEMNGKYLFLCRLEHILAIIPPGSTASVIENVVERCLFCKSEKGEMNMLMDNDGYCIQCRRDKNGNKDARREDWRGVPVNV